MTTIITRSGKGSPLTNDEVDDNFTNLNDDKVEASGDSMTGNLSFGDSNKAIFGAGSDLQIYHDGSNSFVEDTGTGALFAKTNGTGVFLYSGSEALATFNTNGASNLYYDNALKLSTTSTGIDVTGEVKGDSLEIGTNTDGASIEITSAVTDFTLGGLSTGSDLLFSYNRANGDTTIANGTRGSETTRMEIANGGDVSFYNSAGTSQDLFWDASTSRLGLGTTSPSHELHVLSESPQLRLQDSQGSNTYGDMQFNGTALALITRGGASSHGVMRFRSTNGTDTLDRLEILSNGDVVFYDDAGASGGRWDASANSLGIGTVSPAVALDVHDSGDATIRILSTGTGVSDDTILRSQVSGTTASNYLYFGDADDNNSGQIRYVHSDDSMRFYAGATTERLRLYSTASIFYNGVTEIGRFHSNNYFGVGATAPARPLHVEISAGTTPTLSGIGMTALVQNNTSTASSAGYGIISGTAANGSLFFGDSDDADVGRIQYEHNNDAMTFRTNGSEHLRILSSGGITFNGDTATANALDDYEEGTWNITDTSGAGLSFGAATGNYVKIGKLVTCSIQFTFANTTNTNNVSLGGLPFTSENSDDSRGAVSMGYNNSGNPIGAGLVGPNSTDFNIYTSSNQSTRLQNNQLTGSSLYMTITYFTA